MSEQLYKKVGRKYVALNYHDYDDFREYFWTPGLWLVTEEKYSRGRSLLSKLCEIPDKPEHYAGLMKLRDELANKICSIKDRKDNTYEWWEHTPINIAKDILDWLAEKQGVKMIKIPEDSDCDRKIDLTL